MRNAFTVAACIGLLAACGPEGAADRQTGAVGTAADSAMADSAAGDSAPGVTDSTGPGTTGTGTTGAQAGGSGTPPADEEAPAAGRPERD